MRTLRLRAGLMSASLLLVTGLLTACEGGNSSSSGGITSGGTSGGATRLDPNPEATLGLNVTTGFNCRADKNEQVALAVTGASAHSRIAVSLLFPSQTHEERTVKSREVRADKDGNANWSFSCGNLKRGSYRFRATDLSTGQSNTAGYFDVLIPPK